VHADDLFLEARNERVRADLERVTLRLAALERFAVDVTVEVDDRRVAVLHFAFVDDDQLGMALLQTLQLAVHFFFRYFGFHGRNLYALVSAELHFRLNENFRLEDERLALAE